MKIDNVEGLRADVETVLKSVFYDSTVVEKIITIGKDEIIQPTIIEKDKKPLVAVETSKHEIWLWRYKNSTFDLYVRIAFEDFENKTTLIAMLVKQIMLIDRYNWI